MDKEYYRGNILLQALQECRFQRHSGTIISYYVNAIGLCRMKPFHMFFLLFSDWNIHMFSAIVHSQNHMLTPFISLSITCYFRLFPLSLQLWYYPDKDVIVFRLIVFIPYCRIDKVKEHKDIAQPWLFLSVSIVFDVDFKSTMLWSFVRNSDCL